MLIEAFDFHISDHTQFNIYQFKYFSPKHRELLHLEKRKSFKMNISQAKKELRIVEAGANCFIVYCIADLLVIYMLLNSIVYIKVYSHDD